MQILTFDIIFKVIFLLIGIIILLFVNIFFSVYKKHNLFLIGLHFSSFFLASYMICNLLRLIIIDLWFEYNYIVISRISLVAFITSLFITVVFGIIKKKDFLNSVYMNPDLSTVLTAIDDVVIICDYSGSIVEYKNPNAIRILSGEYHQIEQVIKKLVDFALENEQEKINDQFKQLVEPFRFEIEDTEHYHYLVTVSPIIQNQANCLGTIITLHNITQEKNLIKDIDMSNLELEQANIKLAHYVEISIILEGEKERLMLVEGIQSELILRIDLVIAKINELQSVQANSQVEYQQSIALVSSELREILALLRKSIKNIASKKWEETYVQNIISR